MAAAALSLARFSVLDLTRARAGPTCVRQLVDWGARAIKIELPGGRGGDGMGGTRHGFDFQKPAPQQAGDHAQPARSRGCGALTILGHPVSHGAERLPIRTAAPELGQDNEEVLATLGYTKEPIADLAARGVI
jgi:crotonobetainyl-CoA:carnitine CoA-transferase CaiB-like acyl-CoA transferase